MKVVFLTDSLSDLDGVGRYSVRLISALEKLRPDLDVHVLLARKHRPTSADVPTRWKVEVALPPDYFFYMTPSRFRIWRWIGTWRTRRALRGATLVHAIKDYPHSLIAVDAADKAGIPCVATGHGTYTIQPVVQEGPHRALALGAYSRFKALISVSRYTKRLLLELVDPSVLDPGRVHVIPNAVDAESYVAERPVGDTLWKDKRFTLGIGEVKERKGHHLAVAAWAKCARTELDLYHLIVGHKTGDPYEESLRALARAEGVEDRLILLGNVTEDEKVDLLQRAEVFVHTPVTASDGGFEGFGIVYLEAAAAGTPSVGSLDSGAEDAIVDGETGRLVEQNVGAIEAALSELLGDPSKRQALSAGGMAHAERSSWDDNARRVLEIYEGVTQKP